MGTRDQMSTWGLGMLPCFLLPIHGKYFLIDQARSWFVAAESMYRQTYKTHLGSQTIVGHSDVAGASPVGAAPTTSSSST